MGVVTLMLITSEVNANKGGEPPFNMDNSHDFRPGCPIPNCDANFHQGSPDDDIKGYNERGNK